MKQLIIDVEADGTVKIDAVGFRGQACQKATEAMEKALGTPGKRTPKAEWYQSAGISAQQKIRG